MHCPKNIPVVSHGHGRHTQLLHVLTQLFDVTSAIEQGIVGVQVQVDELGHGYLSSLNQRKTRKGVDCCAFRGRNPVPRIATACSRKFLHNIAMRALLQACPHLPAILPDWDVITLANQTPQQGSGL
jgi:hypothetical protein